LSASLSPAPGPCGMPFLVELVPELLPDEEVVVGGAAALDDVDALDDAGALDDDELEELEPQAATARATRTSARGASLRIDVRVFEFMLCSFASETSGPARS
jgi:hypothetical protein